MTDDKLADEIERLGLRYFANSKVSLDEVQEQIIAALRRKPSSDKVLVDRNTLGLAHTWLRAAVECKDWHWDADQHEAATEIADELKKVLAAALIEKLGQGWIPVSERLPEDDRSPVLVNYRAAFHTRKFASGTAKRHRVMFAIFSGGEWRFTLKHEKTRLSERVTHWMPLPPPPERP